MARRMIALLATTLLLAAGTAAWASTKGTVDMAGISTPWAPTDVTWVDLAGGDLTDKVGDGSLVARTRRDGGTLFYYIKFEIGTSTDTSTATGGWNFEIPVPGIAAGMADPAGQTWVSDISGTYGFHSCALLQLPTSVYVSPYTSAGAVFTKTVPITWVDGDFIVLSGWLEIADN